LRQINNEAADQRTEIDQSSRSWAKSGL